MQNDSDRSGVSRRGFLTTAAAGGVLVASMQLPARVARAQRREDGTDKPDNPAWDRSEDAFAVRYEAAGRYLQDGPRSAQPDNGDEARYADLRASFCKTLPQNELGEVDPAAFGALLKALDEGTLEAIEAVPQDPIARRGLANPLASHAYTLVGADGWSLRMPEPPAFASTEIAAEMVEVYWQALTRDLPFREWRSDPDIAAAADDLNRLSHRIGTGAPVDPDNVFRGEATGEDVGPYLSQLLWLPAQWGLAELDQRFRVPERGQDFGVTPDSWLAIQRGVDPPNGVVLTPDRRYLATNRDLAEFVHNDVSYQAYLTAAMVMWGHGDEALDRNTPYLTSDNQEGFVTYGIADIADLVARAANVALKAAWFQKWLCHRRLRPEVFAGRAHFQAEGLREYGIHDELFASEAAARLQSAQGNLLLPLAFPEGSPTHPAYPAGHAAMAGACSTILKGIFDEDYVLPEPVEASADGASLDAWTGEDLTLGGEINKLASNISIGRDAAGVHYRSDGIDGMNLGERVGLSLLAETARTRAESFAGFTLTRFDGTRVVIGGNGERERDEKPRSRDRRRENA